MTTRQRPGTQASTALGAIPEPQRDPDKPDPRLMSYVQEGDQADARLWNVLEKADKESPRG